MELIAFKKIVVLVDDLSESESEDLHRAVALAEKMLERDEYPVPVFAIFLIIGAFFAVGLSVTQSLFHEVGHGWLYFLNCTICILSGFVPAIITEYATHPFQQRDGLELYQLGQRSERVSCFLVEFLKFQPRFKRWMPSQVEAGESVA